MGRKARTKQGVPEPISEAAIARLRKGGAAGGKKTSSAQPDAASPFKAKGGKGPAASAPKKAAVKAVKQKKRVKAVDVVDEDSDVDEALEQG